MCVLRGAAGSESLRKTQINADIQALLEAAGQRCVWWYFAEERRFQADWICVLSPFRAVEQGENAAVCAAAGEASTHLEPGW